MPQPIEQRETRDPAARLAESVKRAQQQQAASRAAAVAAARGQTGDRGAKSGRQGA